MISTEEHIAKLENENISRKSAYPIVGSLVRFIGQTSATWLYTSSGSTGYLTIRVKFKATTADKDGLIFVSLNPEVSNQSDFAVNYGTVHSVNEPQPGDGSIVVRIQIVLTSGITSYYLRVTATGSTPGEFSII